MSRRGPGVNLDRVVGESRTHGVNLRVPLGLESHFGPVRHRCLYHIAPKIIETLKPYHDVNVAQSVGDVAMLLAF